MDEQTAIDLGRHALTVTMLISAPVLIAGMVVGLVVGLLQALTQIQEQTVAFVPKLVAMLLALSLSLPWLTARMLEYSEDLIREIPETISASSE
jgi:flagellar biosynthetic protein FliQ